MKTIKLCLSSLVFNFAAFSAYTQGTVNFNNHVFGLTTHVYASDLYNPYNQTVGNGPTDIPSGTTVYTSPALGGNSFYPGASYTAQLWAAPGLDQPESALQPVSQYTTTFRTESGHGGFIIGVNPSGDPGIPNTGTGGATLQLRVWDNVGLSLGSWPAGNIFMLDKGVSPVFNLAALGPTGGPGVTMSGLQSFNLSVPNPVPEPSTFVLLGLGATYFGLYRRKKK